MVVVHLDLAMAMVKAICTLACTASAIPGHDRPWQLMRHVYCVHVPFECLFEISSSSFRKLSLELCPWIVEFYVLAARDTYAKHPSTSTRQTIAPDRREHARAPIPNAPGNSCAELMLLTNKTPNPGSRLPPLALAHAPPPRPLAPRPQSLLLLRHV